MMITQSLFHLADSAGSVIGKSIAPGCGSSCPGSGDLISKTFPAVADTILFFVGAIAIIMIIVGGLRYVVSAGNAAAVNDAKNTILYAVVGLLIAVSALAIVTFVTGHFGL
jgi:hypothetical protein